MKKQRIKIVLNAPVILTFSLACLIVTILGIVSGGLITQKFFMTYKASLSSPLTYLRAFTHVLGHSGWAHFFGNISLILLLGPMLEEKYGQKKIALIIAITAIATAIINAAFFPGTALCGASGVVFAFILLTSFTEFSDGEIPITFILVAAIYAGQEIINAIFVNDNVSQMAHLIGGAVGAMAGFSWNRKG